MKQNSVTMNVLELAFISPTNENIAQAFNHLMYSAVSSKKSELKIFARLRLTANKLSRMFETLVTGKHLNKLKSRISHVYKYLKNKLIQVFKQNKIDFLTQSLIPVYPSISKIEIGRQTENSQALEYVWVDGSYNKNGSGLGIVSRKWNGECGLIEYYPCQCEDSLDAEFKAVINSLLKISAGGCDQAVIFLDAQGVIDSIIKTRRGQLSAYSEQAKTVLALAYRMKYVCFAKIPREMNSDADHLAELAKLTAKQIG